MHSAFLPRPAPGEYDIPTNLVTPDLAKPGDRKLDNGLGLLYMVAGMFLFAAVDAQAKFLTATLHPIQIVWVRQLGLLVGVFFLLSIRGMEVLRTGHMPLQLLRGALAAFSATLFIVGISFVPLADAVAVSFVAPFIVTVLGSLVLGEPVGVRRWTAVVIGFVGTLIVIRPGSGVVHPAVLVVIVAAGLFALRQIISRALSNSDRTSTTVAYTAIAGSFLLTLPLPFVWRWPQSGTEVALLVSISLLAGLAEFLVIKALEVAHAVVVAPVQYTLIVWSTMYGFLIFGHLPDWWTLVGAMIIIATGLYTLNRERRVSKLNKSRERQKEIDISGGSK